MVSILEFFFSIDWYWYAGAIVASLALFLYYKPKVLLGKPYLEEGKVKELDHKNSQSWTSVGNSFSANGGVGITTSSHYIPEEFEVVIGFGPKYKETHCLNSEELYAAVSGDLLVNGEFQDRTLLYRNGTKEKDGRNLNAIIIDKERFDV